MEKGRVFDCEKADDVVVIQPEFVEFVVFKTQYSVPSGLLLAFQLAVSCVAESTFTDKPVGILARVYRLATAVVDELPARSVTVVSKEYEVLGVKLELSQEVDEMAPELVTAVKLQKVQGEVANPDKASLAPLMLGVREVEEVAPIDKLPAVGATVSSLKAIAPELAVV